MNSGDHPYRRIKHFNNPFEAHELTFSCFQRRPFLARERTCHYLADALTLGRKKHPFHLWAYVIMPEHVHLLVWPHKEYASVEAFLQTVKQSVSRRAMGYLRDRNPQGLQLLEAHQKDNPYRFWQEGPGYDRNILFGKTLLTMVDYIHANPVRRRLIDYPENWKWSSAGDWAETVVGPVRLDKETFPRLNL
jgi:putative transposase